MNVLKNLFSSKKFTAALAGVLVVVAQQFGLPITEEAALSILGMLGTYVVGQGLADFGKERKFVE